MPASHAQTAGLFPDPPFETLPVTAAVQWTPGVQQLTYRWTVKGIQAAMGTGAETFRLDFEDGLTSRRQRSPVDLLGVEVVPGRFGQGGHIGECFAHFGYSPAGVISVLSGSVSLWFALDFDIGHAVYDQWNRLFEYRIDDDNALYIEASKDGNQFTGVSETGGTYYGTWTASMPLEAGDWHHLVWTWDATKDIQQLYLDGRCVSANRAYDPPVGEGSLFLIGCGVWAGPNAYATIDEFRIFSRPLGEFEIRALYLYPDRNMDAALDPAHFQAGDQVACFIRTYNGSAWSGETAAGPRSAVPHPVTVSGITSDVLLPDQHDMVIRVNTDVPALCRCDTSDRPYPDLAFPVTAKGGTVHEFAWPADPDHPLSWTVRCKPDSSTDPWPVSRVFNRRKMLDYDPDFPRIFALWWNYRTSVNIPADMAKYDLVIGSFPKADVFAARRINPDLKALVSYSFSYGGSEDAVFQEAAHDPSDPLYNCVLCDPRNHILYEGYWGHTMYNLTNPACVAYMAERILERWSEDCLVYDGMYFDRVQGNVFWMWNGALGDRNIDIDQDGLGDDHDTIQEAWQQGVLSLLERIREGAPNAVICGNDAIHRYAPYMHGRLFEMGLNGISAGRAEFRPFIEEYRAWTDLHRPPWALPLMTGQGPDWMWSVYGMNPWNTCPADTVEWVRTRYDRMRFGLCSALMGDGLYSYDFGTTWWGHDWWYDEYDFDLGKPDGAARPLNSGILRMDEGFETGNLNTFISPPWNALARITQDPAEVIAGTASLKAENPDQSSIWNEFVWSDTEKIHFKTDTRYSISWKYRVLEKADAGYFYAIVRSGTGNDFTDVWSRTWDPETGMADSLSSVFKTGSHDDYYLIFGIRQDGGIVLDDIRIEEGGEPVWRRDFEYGIALVNPSEEPAEVLLETPYRALAGVQDPSVNHGGIVESVIIPPFDGRILGRDAGTGLYQAGMPESFGLTAFPNPFNTRVMLRLRAGRYESVRVHIHDILGREIRTLKQNTDESGACMMLWDGTDRFSRSCESGVYLVRAESVRIGSTIKVLLLK